MFVCQKEVNEQRKINEYFEINCSIWTVVGRCQYTSCASVETINNLQGSINGEQ